MSTARLKGITVTHLAEFDEIIDVRSPTEYREDHVPGALNLPVLDDAQRARVGTLYKQVSAFEAKKVGAALVSRNVAHHIETVLQDRPRHWRPLVYCWRGGQRSAALVHVLREIGWRAEQLEGGYKAYRRQVLADLERLPGAFRWRVVCGPTGSGKTRLLKALARSGAQVLDLEELARHRGSVLGDWPDASQPSQKMFESRVWQGLHRLDPSRPVFVEAESKKVGNLRVPEALIAAMWCAECVEVQTAWADRIALLQNEYRHFLEDRQALYARLDCLIPLHGHARIEAWKGLAAAGDWPAFVDALLTAHYDPAYRRSTLQHYPRLPAALRVRIEGTDDEAFDRAARELLERMT
jgi:tRNA 2-selenouridine synthase